MRTLVESLKRLFSDGKITEEKLIQMQKEGTITAKEYYYITSTSESL